MLLGGLWHGASVRFILWGALHGIALAIHKAVMSAFPSFKKVGSEMSPFRRIVGVLITFHLVCFGWILFRADSMQKVGEMLTQIGTNFHPEVFVQFVRCFCFDDYRIYIPFRSEKSRKLFTKVGNGFTFGSSGILVGSCNFSSCPIQECRCPTFYLFPVLM